MSCRVVCGLVSVSSDVSQSIHARVERQASLCQSGEALATTEDGRRRLERAKERVDAWIAKEIEAADARPEGEKKQTEEAVPSIAVPFQNHPDPAERDLLDDLLGGDRLEGFRQNVTREKRREARSEGERLRDNF